ncbi:hypothetical protein V8G57_24935 [Collimonas sp. H4R21]|uniref:DUF333 domain-containing protein n=1 Tax=Collimonas rhizosphaerae TaxID=3126357 RepID=A0ABU9Q325_9BURK
MGNFYNGVDNKARQVSLTQKNGTSSYYWRPAINSPEYVRNSRASDRAQQRRHIGMAALFVVLSVGGFALVDDRANAAAEPEPTMMERYCRWDAGTYSAGAKIKIEDGSYQECFIDDHGTAAYWGEASRPRSRSAPLM